MDPTELGRIAFIASVWVLPVLFAITLHEAAHGWTAWKLGDDTAYRRGRVSFNPLRHVDPIGTVALPGLLIAIGAPFLFGWARPVPVDFGRLRAPRRDMVLVAAAGPATNVALAVASALALHLAVLLPAAGAQWAVANLVNSMFINILLAVFNMIPLPPLDGGRVAVGLLPRALALPLARLERHGFLILLAAIFLLPFIGRRIGLDLDIFDWLVFAPARALLRALAAAAGLS